MYPHSSLSNVQTQFVAKGYHLILFMCWVLIRSEEKKRLILQYYHYFCANSI